VPFTTRVRIAIMTKFVLPATKEINMGTSTVHIFKYHNIQFLKELRKKDTITSEISDFIESEKRCDNEK
jgi:hypothetical protein